MQVGAANIGPPAHAGRPSPGAHVPRGGAAPRAAVATTEPAAPQEPGDTGDGVRVRGGPDTPWTHALHQGNGQKVGIHRRFAEEIAAQQAALGLTPPADEVDEAPVADGELVGEVPVGDGEVAGDVPVTDGEVVGDVGAPDTPEPDAVAPGDDGMPDGPGGLEVDASQDPLSELLDALDDAQDTGDTDTT
jgi:hypothetical protein